MATVAADKLRELREAQVMSLSMLAERSGVGRRTIVDLEQGHRDQVHPGTIHRLAAALGVQPQDLVRPPAEALHG